MYHLIFLQILQGIEELDGKPSHQAQREAIEIVQLQKVIEVDAHQLK